VIQENYTTIAAQLREIPDPRSRRGRRYEWQYLLFIVASAMMAGEQSVRGMAQWAGEQAPTLIGQLHPHCLRIPSVMTLHRLLRAVPMDKLERCISAYTAQVDQDEAEVGSIQTKQGQVLRGQSVDGKRVCGASQHGEELHLVSVVRHESGVALAQARVESKIDERKAAHQLLYPARLLQTVTTTDALYTQVKQAEQILAGGGHYLMVVKCNQPSLYQAIELAFAACPPINQEERAFWRFQTHITTDKAHGRLERRTLVSTPALNDYLDWPGVAQVLRRTCQRTELKSGKCTTHMRLAVTSLPRRMVTLAQIELLWRRHWTIENQLHHVRDVSFGEDRCQVHTGHAPQALAALRNGILALLRYEGWPSPPAAFRHFRIDVQHALRLLGAIAT
jgi:predicted transposase YbfD/YdcC